jgi:2-polyprenyl-3-methyl-5-hydroxy-6-metoxy-1,4-benzoquinol methylase
MASKERQIKRWNNLQHPRLNSLNCIICEYTDLNQNFSKLYANDIFCAGTLIRHKCPNCGLIFGDLRFLNLSEEEINDDHEDVYSYYSEGNTVPYILDNLNSLDIFKNKNLSYLDYACGIGKMIPILKDKGYNIYGYDKYVKNNNVLNNIDNTKFDVIYTNNFIEHVINPIEDIKKILLHLNDNGYLIIMSDCFDEYKIEYTHYHLYFYTGNSFNILCDKLNLDIIDNKTVGECKIKVLKKK